ncbi:hypothetical protein BB560_000288 [Smittium megazygosporum]|uniref:Protein PBN1 n=1 Tax=Smittium megazygosporum TaxID=133381 RepID=A0A2T9ZKS0_9FUNG|nr:hypothetical protein BB560_000288 [Smittium megazygosporum]
MLYYLSELGGTPIGTFFESIKSTNTIMGNIVDNYKLADLSPHYNFERAEFVFSNKKNKEDIDVISFEFQSISRVNTNSNAENSKLVIKRNNGDGDSEIAVYNREYSSSKENIDNGQDTIQTWEGYSANIPSEYVGSLKLTKSSFKIKYSTGEKLVSCIKSSRKDFNSDNTRNLINSVSINLSIQNPNSFHPTIVLSFPNSDLNPAQSCISKLCSLKVIQPLWKSYFFDPYQIYDMRSTIGQMFHLGMIELELPAEANGIKEWGSILQLSPPVYQNLEKASSSKINSQTTIENNMSRLTPTISILNSDAKIRTSNPILLGTIGQSLVSSFNPKIMKDHINVRVVVGSSVNGMHTPIQENAIVLRMPIVNGDISSFVKWTTLLVVFLGTSYLLAILKKVGYKS